MTDDEMLKDLPPEVREKLYAQIAVMKKELEKLDLTLYNSISASIKTMLDGGVDEAAATLNASSVVFDIAIKLVSAASQDEGFCKAILPMIVVSLLHRLKPLMEKTGYTFNNPQGKELVLH